MTSLLTHIETASSQSNSQQQATEDIQLHIPKLNDTEESQFSNLVKPSSLLAKRLDISELGDLITKRVKTQSTNVSDNGSIADSPTSKKNPLANEKDKNSTDDAVSTTFTRCSSSESALGLPIQDSFTGSPVVIDIDTQSEESGVQLQLALNLLRERMIEHEAQNLLEMFLVAQLCQEPLYIPPLMETPTTLVEPVVAKKQPKKEFKKMELDHEVTYGTVEYPFLSISAPFPEDGDLSSIPKLDLSRLTMAVEEDPYADLTCKDPYLDEQIPVAFSNIEKKMKKTEKKNQASSAPRSPSSTQSSSEKKKSAKGKEEKNGKKVVEKVQKKGKEDKKMEKEVVAESSKTVKQDNIYARPAFGRRFTQRTKNKWQIAQDEKVKDIVLPALNFNGGYELFFEGNKKKPVPIGEEYQTDMSIVALQSKSTRRRKPQMKWDPSSHCEGELKKFFNKVKTMTKGEINEEKVVGMILDNENDLKRALKYITANKAKCLDTLRC